MKGGFNNPPNLLLRRGQRLRRVASMKGGFNNPPNLDGADMSWAEFGLQ